MALRTYPRIGGLLANIRFYHPAEDHVLLICGPSIDCQGLRL